MLLYLMANVGLALTPTDAYWLLLLMRALQATGGSAVISIGAGAISDIAEPRERGKFMSIFQCGVVSAEDRGDQGQALTTDAGSLHRTVARRCLLPHSWLACHFLVSDDPHWMLAHPLFPVSTAAVPRGSM